MTQRVALVTGAMGGIGTAICQELAKAGHKVVAAYHPEFDKPEEWTKAMAEAGFNDFICVAGDVSDYDSCVALTAEAEAKAGPIDILVNNAGITSDAQLVKMSTEQFDKVINVNLKGVFLCTRAVAPYMISQGSGRNKTRWRQA